MVHHLAPDSRLLVSLVKQEQAYAAQLRNLLNASGASLSALAVYASSSPPTVSPVLNGVAGAFSGADEALRTYGEALNNWIEQLGRIKQKEEEVVNIGRDREILVTRLLKVSQKSKSPPPSLLHLAQDLSSSTSFSTFNSKINIAQTELQACESRLAEKERELESVRVNTVRQGLKLRCSALVQCGQRWGEMGRRALEMLDELDGIHPPSNGHATEFFKPLPDPTPDHDRDSVRSSLSPSQSASQIGAIPPLSLVPLPPEKPYQLDIPPPHLMSDANVIPQTSVPEGNSSSEDEGPVEVYENARFKPAPILNKNKKHTWTAPPSPARYSPIPFPATSSDLGPSNKIKQHEKRRRGLFGNIAALFRTSMSPKSTTQNDGVWSTRTDQNLRGAKTDGEQSSDDEDAQPRSGRLQKGKRRAPLDDRRSARATDSDGLAQTSDLLVPAPAPHNKRSGKLGRSSTVRSTVSEPPGPRLRANTLSTVSSGPAVPTGGARKHGRTASVDGRWGLPGAGTDIASVQTWKPAKTKRESLMRIVEGPSYNDPSSRLEVVRAPGSTIPRLPLLVNHPPPLPVSASEPSSPVMSKTAASKRASMPVPTTTTPGLLVSPAPLGVSEKKPLRSAMRKSPSPSASPNVRATTDDDQSLAMAPLSLPAPSTLSPNPRPNSLPRREIPSTIVESPHNSTIDQNARQSYTSDSASISSYETGHENLDDEGTETEQERTHTTTPAPPPPPEKAAAPSPQGPTFQGPASADQHELSSATSTDTAAPARRKSVRMSSLPPQVSATPPALDEYNDVDHLPWGKTQQQQGRAQVAAGWRTRIPAGETALSWDDSSSEDETYKAARRALSLADRSGSEKKAKR